MTSAILGSTDQDLYRVECAILALLVTAWTLGFLLRGLGRSRPGFAIGLPIAVAVAVRVLAIAVLSSITSLTSVRGPDDAGFLAQAAALADQAPWTRAWLDISLGDLHLAAVAGQISVLGEPGDFSLRVVQVLIAVSGIALLAAAAFDLGGPRASKLAAWALAFEPASVFFSGLVHKEALTLLAVGTVGLGAARMWTKRDARSGLLLGGGVGIALATRPYTGAFLLGAAGLVTLHAALRRVGPDGTRAIPLAAALAAIGLVGAVALAMSPSAVLDRIQRAQDVNTADRSNLRLDPVDFSTLEAVGTNLPGRVRDLMLRPYPWQDANLSQRFGGAGTAAAWAILTLVVLLVSVRFRQTLRRAPPFVYVALFLVVAFALATGNAGTGFRYRTHVVALLIGVGAVLAAAPTARRNTTQPPEASAIGSRHRMRPPLSSS